MSWRRAHAGQLRVLVVEDLAAVRRAPSTPPVLQREDLTVDRAPASCNPLYRPLSLTRKEFGMTLITADGDQLLEYLWDATVDPFSNIGNDGPVAPKTR